ncbi:hypothetical protein ACHAXA_005452 [Cyclostephanos tholiformis]|uniref:Uncharacterized protein n=1 Tax=Cyclostephanos tholiformis TaxID=382380 RepID=A0ABD3SHQ0_9STRA
MNYAEDRLDRRAAARTPLSSQKGDADKSPSGKVGGTHGDELESDLARARAVFDLHANILRRRICRPRSSSSDNKIDDGKGNDDESTAKSLRELRVAHEMTGRALRDSGLNAHASFHFGMAWIACHRLLAGEEGETNEEEKEGEEWKWRSIGDYAQMCELSGFPELGVLAILFHRAGGCPNDHNDDYYYHDCHDDDGMDNDVDNPKFRQWRAMGCGCGVVGCGESPCYVAFPTKSTVVDNVLEALGKDSSTIGGVDDDDFPKASDVLARLASIILMSNDDSDVGVAKMSSFLRGAMRDVPSILRFWEGHRHHHHYDDDRLRHRWRILPPVIQLLLLKLLYSSPLSGPFLRLACVAVPHLAARFTPASSEGRTLSRTYKSHWAYYVLVRSLVLGERTKERRRGACSGGEANTRSRHVPVWDVVFGMEERAGGGSMTKGGGDVAPIGCGDFFRDILRFVERSRASDDEWTGDIPNRTSWSLPPVVQQCISSFASHPPIFVVGDSHVLSLAWQTLRIDLSRTVKYDGGPVFRTAIPFPATGIKAWHVRSSTRFFTHYNLRVCLDRLSRTMRGDCNRTAKTIIFSAGEIDCREGIGGSLLQGYYRDCGDAVRRTVTEYLTALSDLAREYRLQILVMPVAPHAYRSEKNGKSTGRARRRETTHIWNETMRSDLGCGWGRRTSTHSTDCVENKNNRVYLLDYEMHLHQDDANSPVGYVLHSKYNADYTHVNSAIVPLVEDAILNCGCDLTVL